MQCTPATQSRRLHQRIDEHRYSAIGKHLKNDNGLETVWPYQQRFRFKEVKRKTGPFDL